MSSQITNAQPSNIHAIGNLLGTCALISIVTFFYNLPQLRHVTASRPSPGDEPPEQGPKEHRNRWQSKVIIYICTRVLHSLSVAPLLVGQHSPSQHPSNLTQVYPPSTDFRNKHPISRTELIYSLHVPKPPQHSLIHFPSQLPIYSSSITHLFIPNYPFMLLSLKISNTSSQEHSLLFFQKERLKILSSSF